jgi:hypothetical protein
MTVAGASPAGVLGARNPLAAGYVPPGGSAALALMRLSLPDAPAGEAIPFEA